MSIAVEHLTGFAKRPWVHSPFLCSLVSWWQLAERGQEVADLLCPKQLAASMLSPHNMQTHAKGFNSVATAPVKIDTVQCWELFSLSFSLPADKNGAVVTLSRWQLGPWEASFALLLHNYRYSDLCSTTLRALLGWLVNGVQKGIHSPVAISSGKIELRHWWVLNTEGETTGSAGHMTHL